MSLKSISSPTASELVNQGAVLVNMLVDHAQDRAGCHDLAVVPFALGLRGGWTCF